VVFATRRSGAGERNVLETDWDSSGKPRPSLRGADFASPRSGLAVGSNVLL
jgi:hypothetical protein